MSLVLVLVGVSRLTGQNVATSLLVLSRDGRRAIPLTVSGGQEMVGLDDLASAFQLSVREERDALGSHVTRRAPTIHCESCGRDVELVVHPATGRSYVYPMHVKARASTVADPTAVRHGGTP